MTHPEPTAPVVELTWSPPLLQDNTWLTWLVLTMALLTVLAMCRGGVMHHQLRWLSETRNARTFEKSVVQYTWLRRPMLAVLFVATGLSALSVVDGTAMARHLLGGDMGHWLVLAACIAAPWAWYMLQMGLFNWLGYLFGCQERLTIMNRVYTAIHVLLAPMALALLMAVTTGLATGDMVVILLAALFIMSQITFIFNGFKIFWGSFGATLIIILYLCALEIAPLAIILSHWA